MTVADGLVATTYHDMKNSSSKPDGQFLLADDHRVSILGAPTSTGLRTSRPSLGGLGTIQLGISGSEKRRQFCSTNLSGSSPTKWCEKPKWSPLCGLTRHHRDCHRDHIQLLDGRTGLRSHGRESHRTPRRSRSSHAETVAGPESGLKSRR